MGFDALAGNEALKQRLAARLTADEPVNAYLISGPEGSGRHTLAGLLAMAMVCTDGKDRPCLHCPACRKAAGGIHPDVIVVAPEQEGKEITVDQIRAMRSDAYVRPNEAARKVYRIERADRLNAAGQNAMLKVLEDGPGYAVFLLMAENAGGLLPTVRSRCQGLALAPVAKDQAERWLAAQFPDVPEDRRARAAEESRGLLGRAAALLVDGQEEDDEICDRATELWLAGDEAGLMELCVGMEKWDRGRFTALLDGMTRRLSGRRAPARRLLRLAALLDELRAAQTVNTNPGHLAGWLCAACAAGTEEITAFGGDPL